MPTSVSALPATPPDGRSDFDFLMGAWTVRHHRLRTRLAGDTAWDDFDGTCTAFHVLGGAGNVDDNVLELPGGTYRAATVRAFDAEAGRWSIWWLDARRSELDAPVHGRFDNGVGTFFGDALFEGRPIRVRFIWSKITPRSAQWEQAFSADGGAHWETNWVMAFTRTG